jgi:cytochrome P450
MQNDIDNIFLRKAQLTVDMNPEDLIMVKLGNLFPFLIPFIKWIIIIRVILFYLFRKIAPAWFLPQIEEAPPFWIINRAQQIIDKKLSNDQQTYSIDLLQLMLDASTKDSINNESKVLHQDEVSTNIFLFMIAGYETTSTALASSTYILATKSDIQDQLRAEIDEQEWKEDNEANYDIVMNMNYMDLFVREVLRMYPISTVAMTRECNTSANICGHQIEKGSVIQPDVFTVHFDANLWGPEDPNLFYPERHSTKRHPAAFMPFGIGPRNCVGMRFALMELKMCLVQLMRQYIILPGDKIEQGFQFDETLVIRPNGMYIKLEKR